MNIFILILLFTLLSYLGFKILFLLAHQSFTERILFKNRSEFVKFIINPVLTKKYSKDKYFIFYYYISFFLTTSWTIVLTGYLDRLIDLFKINMFIGVLFVVSVLIFIGFLLYLSIFDILSFSIPEIVSKRMLLFAAVINLLFFLLKNLLSNTEYSYIFNFINLGALSNLLGGLLGAGIIWSIVRLSKEKAMGSGDIDILAGIGLMLGFPSILYSFFYTLIAASVISIIYVAIIKKYKGVLIPFVPFLASGYILCLVFSDSIVRIFNIY